MTDVPSLPALAPESLPEQLGDIGLVVHDQDTEAHDTPLTLAAHRRGKRTLNAGNPMPTPELRAPPVRPLQSVP